MSLDLLLPLIAVFALGAMSPGPSLAVVLRNSLIGGRRHGVMTGLGHAVGFGIYAFMAAVGIAAAISASSEVADVIRWGGIALLIYLAYIFAKSARSGHVDSVEAELDVNLDHGADPLGEEELRQVLDRKSQPLQAEHHQVHETHQYRDEQVQADEPGREE